MNHGLMFQYVIFLSESASRYSSSILGNVPGSFSSDSSVDDTNDVPTTAAVATKAGWTKPMSMTDESNPALAGAVYPVLCVR